MGKISKKSEKKSRFEAEQIKGDFNQCKLKLSFEFLSGDHCISMCQQKEKAEVIDSLHRISKYTWRDCIQLGKSGCGYEQLDRSQIKCTIPRDDFFKNLDKVTVFHRKNKIPIVGFRIQDTFYIFCIDRRFDAYEHGGS